MDKEQNITTTVQRNEPPKYEVNSITVVSPMWGERSKTDRMVFSVIHQFISNKNPINIHLVLVDDYLEGRGEDGSSPYDYYLSDEFKALYDADHIKISLIKNEEHKYQGESREIGFMAGDHNWFVLIDCDDMLAPNACDRYLGTINEFYQKNEDGTKKNGIREDLACVLGLLYSFDTYGYDHCIPGESIWVQGRCYNRGFITKHGIHFPTGMNSRQGEDYPFIRKFDYAVNHDPDFMSIKIPYKTAADNDCQATAFWFPNENSLSRQDPHYGQHLSGWTMASSNSILDFFDEYNKLHGFVDQEDEFMKHEYLNMNIYAFYNLLDFIKEVSATDYKPLEEDWYALRDNVRRLRSRLKDKYWDEIVYSDIEDMLYQVKHFSDCRFTECWFGTFYDYMNKGTDILDMNYDEMFEYSKSLQFDGAGHEIHSPQVIAWQKRHPAPEPEQKPKKRSATKKKRKK